MRTYLTVMVGLLLTGCVSTRLLIPAMPLSVPPLNIRIASDIINIGVTQCLSERYQCEVTHYYAESGCGYCGCTIFDNGKEVEQQADDLIFSEENDEGYTDIIGPDYILKNIGHYGG